MANLRCAALGAFTLLCGVSGAHADFIDGDFENPAIASGSIVDYRPGSTFGGASGTAWTVNGPQEVSLVNAFQNSGSTFQAHTGAAWVDLTGPNDNGSPNSISQSVATTIGQRYSVGFWIGHYTGDPGRFESDAPTIIGVLLNGQLVGEFTNASNTPSAGGNNNWSFASFDFTASAAATSFTFRYDQPLGGRVAGLDDISLAPFVAAVPGPIAGAGIPALLALGGVMWARRRKTLAA